MGWQKVSPEEPSYPGCKPRLPSTPAKGLSPACTEEPGNDKGSYSIALVSVPPNRENQTKLKQQLNKVAGYFQQFYILETDVV